MSTKNEQNFVLEKIRTLLSRGYTQREIATEMQISLGKTNQLVQTLKEEAKNNIRTYVNEELPSAFESTLTGIDQIIKITWDSVDKTTNARERYPGLSLLMQAYEVKLHLLSSAETLKEAVSFVDSHNQRLKDNDNNDDEVKAAREPS